MISDELDLWRRELTDIIVPLMIKGRKICDPSNFLALEEALHEILDNDYLCVCDDSNQCRGCYHGRVDFQFADY